jgi:outer membrane protein OmpA-like peptidoglycan-associated protein
VETRNQGSTLAWIALAPWLALACASPTPPAGLTDAQAAYKKAAATPTVQQEASVELYEAKQALDRAQSEWDETHEATETAHLAYLAKRRVEIAEYWASGRTAGKKTMNMAEQAQTARAEAETAKQAAAEATAREKQLREEMSELQARETARGLEMTLGDILFDVGKATLKPGAMKNLYRLVTFLKEYPDRAVLVEGHTDSSGSDATNLALSQQRADSVRSFLIENGIEPGRVLARGYGKAYPVAGNDTAEGRQKNRRVDVVILNPGQSPEGQLRPAAP